MVGFRVLSLVFLSMIVINSPALAHPASTCGHDHAAGTSGGSTCKKNKDGNFGWCQLGAKEGRCVQAKGQCNCIEVNDGRTGVESKEIQPYQSEQIDRGPFRRGTGEGTSEE